MKKKGKTFTGIKKTIEKKGKEGKKGRKTERNEKKKREIARLGGFGDRKTLSPQEIELN